MIIANGIRAWMRRHVSDYVDECGEVNCTRMVEDWDNEEATGMSTISPNHIAWDIAVDVAQEYEERP